MTSKNFALSLVFAGILAGLIGYAMVGPRWKVGQCIRDNYTEAWHNPLEVKIAIVGKFSYRTVYWNEQGQYVDVVRNGIDIPFGIGDREYREIKCPQ